MANRRQRQSFSSSRGQKGKFAEWLRKNKHTARFEALVQEGMALYIQRLNSAMEEKFEASRGRPTASTIRWRRWVINKGSYVRGEQFGGRRVNVDSSVSPAKGMYLSGKLKAVISSCRVEVIGGDIRIITPKYIDDFRKLDPTKNNVTVQISQAIEGHKGRDYRNPPSAFLGPNGAQFRLAKQRVMALLRKEAGII